MNPTIQPENKIFEILSDVTANDVATIKPEQTLVDDLGMDSLDILTVGSEMEKHFEITIPDAEIENVKTVQDLIQLVLNKQNAVK